MKDFYYENTLSPAEMPEVVALGSQSVEEVKKILNEAERAECEAKEKRAQEIEDLFDELTDADDIKLCYHNEMHDDCTPNLCEVRNNCGFRKDIDVFALWRKLADVKVGDDALEIEALNPTKNLMDYILIQLKKSFPKLKLEWADQCWNQRLTINGCGTHVTMERLALAYQGIINITDELHAQAIIANIVNKKLRELFI